MSKIHHLLMPLLTLLLSQPLSAQHDQSAPVTARGVKAGDARSSSLHKKLSCLYQYQNLLSPSGSMRDEGISIYRVGDGYRVLDTRALDAGKWKLYSDNYEAVEADIRAQNLEATSTVSISLGHTFGWMKLDGSASQLSSTQTNMRQSSNKRPELKTRGISFDLDIESLETTFASRASKVAEAFKRANPQALDPQSTQANAQRSREILGEFTARCSELGSLKAAMQKIQSDFRLGTP